MSAPSGNIEIFGKQNRYFPREQSLSTRILFNQGQTTIPGNNTCSCRPSVDFFLVPL